MKIIKIITTMLTMILIIVALQAENRITLYHGGFGLVNESINIPIHKGPHSFHYTDIPSSLDANSVILKPSDHDLFTIQTQSYVNITDTWFEFLNRHSDIIELIMNDGSIIKGNLFYNDRTFLGLRDKDNNRKFFIRLNEIRNITAHSITEYFRTKPLLSWDIIGHEEGTHPASLTYLCTGFNWEGIYKAVWKNNELILDVMANISNHTGKDYHNYQLVLVAGEPKRIGVSTQQHRDVKLMASSAIERESSDFDTQAFDEYHVFTYSKPVDIINQRAKQIRLYPTKSTTPEVYYEYQTGSDAVFTKIKIQNKQQMGLGIALPKGIIHVYRDDNTNVGLTFVGEDIVSQIPVKEEWVISPGKTFDVVGKTDAKSVRRPSRNITERDMEVNIKNRSDDLKNIEIIHNLSSTWTIIESSHEFLVRDASTIVFKQVLNAQQESTFLWTERIEH